MEILQNITWQDAVISIAQILLFLALLPSIFSKHKPNWKTSLLSGIVLTALGITYLSLNFFLSTIFTFLGALGWYILFIQKIYRWKRSSGR